MKPIRSWRRSNDDSIFKLASTPLWANEAFSLARVGLFTCRVSVVVGPTSFYYSSSVFSSASSETAIACFVGNFLYFNLRRTSSLFAGGRGGLRAIHNEPDSSSFNLIDQSATHVHCSCGVNFNYRPTRQPPANFQLWYSTWCSDDVPGEASVWAAAAVSESGCSGLQNLVA